jgi:hypothetical protein
MNGTSSLAAVPIGHDLVGMGSFAPKPAGVDPNATQFAAEMAGYRDPAAPGPAPELHSLEAPQPVGALDRSSAMRPSYAETSSNSLSADRFNSANALEPLQSPGAVALAHLNLPGLVASPAAPTAAAPAKAAAGNRSPAAHILQAVQEYTEATQTEFKVLFAPPPLSGTTGNAAQDQAAFYGRLIDMQREMMKLQIHMSLEDTLQSIPKNISNSILNMQS